MPDHGVGFFGQRHAWVQMQGALHLPRPAGRAARTAWPSGLIQDHHPPPDLSLITVMRTGVYTLKASRACVCSKVQMVPFSTCAPQQQQQARHV